MKMRELFSDCYTENVILVDNLLISAFALNAYSANYDELFIRLGFITGEVKILHFGSLEELENIWNSLTSIIKQHESTDY